MVTDEGVVKNGSHRKTERLHYPFNDREIRGPRQAEVTKVLITADMVNRAWDAWCAIKRDGKFTAKKAMRKALEAALNDCSATDTFDDKWTGRVYRDNDPRYKETVNIDILSEPDENGRVRVLRRGGRNKVKVQIKRLNSSSYTRLVELER